MKSAAAFVPEIDFSFVFEQKGVHSTHRFWQVAVGDRNRQMCRSVVGRRKRLQLVGIERRYSLLGSLESYDREETARSYDATFLEFPGLNTCVTCSLRLLIWSNRQHMTIR